jgi:hypothetical protein
MSRRPRRNHAASKAKVALGASFLAQYLSETGAVPSLE